MGPVLAATIGCVLASLVALARPSPRHAWLRSTMLGLVGGGTVLYSALPWVDDPPGWLLRGFGVVMIASPRSS